MKYALAHYYGDIVRYLFLAAAIILIIGLPLFQSELNVPILISIAGVIILAIAAGLTNPKQLISAVVNFIIALVSFGVFLYAAVTSYQASPVNDKFLLANIILSGIFLFAVYFSMKTLHGELLDKNADDLN